MSWFSKNKKSVIHRLTPREQGQYEAFVASQAAAQATVTKFLQAVMKRHNIEASNEVAWSPDLQAFIKVTPKETAVSPPA